MATPAHDPIERAENVLGEAHDRFRVTKAMRDLIEHAKNLQDRVDELEREREPFKVVMDRACEVGIGHAPHKDHSANQREAWAREVRAAAQTANELALRLGFKVKEPRLDFQGGPTVMLVRLTRGLERRYEMHISEANLTAPGMEYEQGMFGEFTSIQMMRQRPMLRLQLEGQEVP